MQSCGVLSGLFCFFLFLCNIRLMKAARGQAHISKLHQPDLDWMMAR